VPHRGFQHIDHNLMIDSGPGNDLLLRCRQPVLRSSMMALRLMSCAVRFDSLTV